MRPDAKLPKCAKMNVLGSLLCGLCELGVKWISMVRNSGASLFAETAVRIRGAKAIRSWNENDLSEGLAFYNLMM